MGVLDRIEGRRKRREEQRRLAQRAPIELRDWVVATAREGSLYQAVDLLVMKVCIERISHSTLVEAWSLTNQLGMESVESYGDAMWIFQRALDRLNRTPPPHFGAIVKPRDAAD